MKINIRTASRADVTLILGFIKALAEYEKLQNEVTANESLLTEWIFDKGKAEVLIGEVDGEASGFALFFHNFSTFLGKANIYLEDLYVIPEKRGIGLGKALLQTLAKLTVERGCGRLEWSCLDWNKESIGFYMALGAVPMEDWTIYRMTGNALTDFANKT